MKNGKVDDEVIRSYDNGDGVRDDDGNAGDDDGNNGHSGNDEHIYGFMFPG